jgi:hypothetical protein
MAAITIEVSSYAGYRGEESPRIFFVHGEKITVQEILEMWFEEEGSDRKRKRYFRVKGSDGLFHKLHYDLSSQQWLYNSFAKDPRDLG